jgi:chemotaxis-related protein WspD
MTCWNEIGDRGDSSCQDLRVHTHCRDCPTFKAAAAQLLEAPLARDEMMETAAYLTRPKATISTDSPFSAVIFRAGGTWLGLPSDTVEEIASPGPIHALPHRRQGAVLGVTNVRGELLVCVALPLVLALASNAERPADGQAVPRMIVTRQNGARTVYPVEEVVAVERFLPGDCVVTPALVAKATDNFTKAVLHWRGTPVSLLDADLLLAAVNRSLALATAI